MADDKKVAQATDAEAARKAADAARKQAEKDAAAATEEARKQDQETNKEQAEGVPYPSQEEADRIKAAAAEGAATYQTRDMKA